MSWTCHSLRRLSPPQLAFRQTVHQYGVDLCWTPMILAKEYNRSEFARDSGELSHSSSSPWDMKHRSHPRSH